ncbi:MAG: hypothetical protein GY938_18295 [Ketobacter sp.]|nr:hypothetical protein [Ketobacter sp.]
MNKLKNIVMTIALLGLANAASAGWGFDDLKELVPLKKTQNDSEVEVEETAGIDADKASEVQATTAETQAKVQQSEAKKVEAEAKMDVLVDENERVVKRLIASLLRVAEAQANFAEALDAKDQADQLRAESKALGEANYTDKSALHRHVKVSKATNKVIQKKIALNQELSQEGREQFSTGMLHYVIAVKETKEMTDEIGPFYDATMAEAKTVQSLINQSKNQNNVIGFITNVKDYATSRFGKKFATTKYLVKNSKGLAKDHKATVNSVVEYARNNDIEVPKEVETSLDFI